VTFSQKAAAPKVRKVILGVKMDALAKIAEGCLEVLLVMEADASLQIALFITRT
jgi:hypothetical protein